MGRAWLFASTDLYCNVKHGRSAATAPTDTLLLIHSGIHIAKDIRLPYNI